MAEASVSVSQDQLNCSICLDLLKNPATIPCGHSFCMDCITACWNQDDRKKVYSCPQCKQTFTTRPALSKNTILAEMLVKFKGKKRKQPAPAADCYAGPGDVECDVCTGRKHKAVSSCLVCLCSYCNAHLILHSNLDPGKKHKLIDATGKLQDLICAQHDKLLEVFCQTDQTCICLLCVMDQHTGHKTVSVSSERTTKQRHLPEIQRKSQKRIQEREVELQKLKKSLKVLKCSAQTAVKDTEKVFADIIRSFERRCSQVTDMIRSEVSQTEGLVKQMEQEIAELRRRDADLQKLSQTKEHISFLQSFQSLHTSSRLYEAPRPTIDVDVSFKLLKTNLSDLTEIVGDILQQELYNISEKAKVIKYTPPPEPKTREDFLAYSCPLTLDPNTAHIQLYLSDENREVTCTEKVQPYPTHPERFDWQQVLCREDVCGRCYWEVQCHGDASRNIYIAVSYKEISRKGFGIDSWFGKNNQSWCLSCTCSGYYFMHNNVESRIPVSKDLTSSRIGVFVDYRAGILSFYSISGTMTLLHKVQTTFTQPLYPGFCLSVGSKAKLCY